MFPVPSPYVERIPYSRVFDSFGTLSTTGSSDISISLFCIPSCWFLVSIPLNSIISYHPDSPLAELGIGKVQASSTIYSTHIVTRST